MKTKLVKDLERGDLLILDNGERATVSYAVRSGIIEMSSGGSAFEVRWRTESGEKRGQFAPPNAAVRVE